MFLLAKAQSDQSMGMTSPDTMVMVRLKVSSTSEVPACEITITEESMDQGLVPRNSIYGYSPTDPFFYSRIGIADGRR